MVRSRLPRNTRREDLRGAAIPATIAGMSETLPAPAPDRVLPRTSEMREAGTDTTQSKHMVLIDAIIAWMIGNPGKPLTQCAAALRLSSPWVRMVASSDFFKARLAEQRDGMIAATGILTLRERIAVAAEVAVERLTEKIAVSDNMEEITDATEMLLDKYYDVSGEGPKGNGQVNVNITAIMQGRDQMLGKTEQPAIDVQEIPKCDSAP